MKLFDGGLSVRNTATKATTSLASPVMKSGTASATFRLQFKGFFGHVVGVFPATQKLDVDANASTHESATLWVGYLGRSTDDGGYAQLVCDGMRSERVTGLELDWQNSELRVDVVFVEWYTARVTFSGRNKTWEATLRGVPACGLRFGVGMGGEGDSVTLVWSTTTA